MNIKVDYRETDLITAFKTLVSPISIENLPIGDIIFFDGDKFIFRINI